MGKMSQIHAYITETKAMFPGIPKYQLIAMLVLHFDIPDESAKKMVEDYEKTCF